MAPDLKVLRPCALRYIHLVAFQTVTRILCTLLAVAVPAVMAQGPPTFSPPASSVPILKGVPFSSATAAGEQFRRRFSECDTKDTCDGKRLTFGCSKDPNRNTALLSFHGNAVFFNGKLGLDADGSPLSKKTQATDQPETSFRYPSSGRLSVDSDKVPFIVIPGGGFGKGLGIELGDIADVVHNNRVVFALVADQGPVCKLGEGSIELHEQLGHKVCLARNSASECTKLNDVGIERDVLYFIFPKSKARIITGLSPANVKERLSTEGQRLFAALKAPQ